MQNFRMAHPLGQYMDIIQVSSKKLGPQPGLCTLHSSLAECRYTRRVWALVATWLGSQDLHPTGWTPSTSTSEWWLHVISIPNTPRERRLALADTTDHLGDLEREEQPHF
jgi:hypothetical protein